MNDDFDAWLDRQSRTSQRLKWGVGALLVLLIVGVAAAPALSHEWYPPKCCSGRDCFATSAANVLATPDGWLVQSSGEVIPFDDPRVHQTPPEGGGEFHVCHLAGDPKLRALCLFVPEFGA